MTVLRQVIARFDISADTKPLTDMDKAIDRSRKKVEEMGQYLAVAWAAVGTGIYVAVEAASHAQETMSALKATFKGSSDEVVSWSKNMSKYLGLSEFSLQESALKFGAFLGPVFRDSGQDVTDMSTKLSVLAADLAAFYDTSNEEAMMRLFSGMSGETEAVRRLGIDISDTSLDDLNKKNGDNRRMASLTLQEKTALRFQKIMMDTEEKQGQANRELQQWAGQMKQLREKIKDLTIRFGQQLMPVALKVIHKLNDLWPVVERIVLRSKAFEVALKALTIATIATAIAFIALNPVAAALTAIMIGFLAIWEDLEVAMAGGDTIIGNFFKNFLGIDNIGQRLQESIEDIIGEFDIFIAVIRDLTEMLVYVTSRGREGDFELDHVKAARAREGQRDKNREAVEADLQRRRVRAAAAGDEDTYRGLFPGKQMTDKEATEKWLADRAKANQLNSSLPEGQRIPWKEHPSDQYIPSRSKVNGQDILNTNPKFSNDLKDANSGLFAPYGSVTPAVRAANQTQSAGAVNVNTTVTFNADGTRGDMENFIDKVNEVLGIRNDQVVQAVGERR